MNQLPDLQARPSRQQNYQFAYHLVPQYLFRGDLASTIPMAHPHGFDYWEKNWERMSIVFPDEHVVQGDGITTQAYFMGGDAFALLVRLPSSDNSLEASHLIIVFRSEIAYFVLGNGIDASGVSTLRRIDTNANARCGHVRELTDESILAEVCSALGIQPEVRPADDDEFRAIAESVTAFPPSAEGLPFNDVWEVGVMYRVLSATVGDTTNLSPAEAGELVSRLPPQAHALGAAYLKLISSKPDLSRADMDALVTVIPSLREQHGPWAALDAHADQTWCYVTCVTEDRVAYACLKRGESDNVKSIIQSGGDLIEFMEKAVPLGHRVKIVPLDQLQTIEWHGDDADVVFRHWNPEKTKLQRTSITLRDESSRLSIVDATSRGAGVAFVETASKPSIWHVGVTQLILSGVAVLIFVIPGVAGIFDPGEIDTESSGRNAAKKEMIKGFYNTVGPSGMLLIGAGIVFAMLIWWYVAYRFPPKKIIATAAPEA